MSDEERFQENWVYPAPWAHKRHCIDSSNKSLCKKYEQVMGKQQFEAQEIVKCKNCLKKLAKIREQEK